MAAQLVTDQIRKAVRIRGSLGANTHNSGGGPGAAHGPPPPLGPLDAGLNKVVETEYRLLVADSKAGGIIGKGGEVRAV